jgi:hypothetical protein
VSSQLAISILLIGSTPFAHLSKCAPLLIHGGYLADIISTVEFDSTGNYLATGDKGGRVVLFERNELVRFFRWLVSTG